MAIYSCSNCSYKSDSGRNFKIHLNNCISKSAQDASLLNALDRFQAKHSRKLASKAEAAAKRCRLMKPVEDQEEDEEPMDIDSEWYNIPFHDTGPVNEEGPSGSGSNPLVAADPEVRSSFTQADQLIRLPLLQVSSEVAESGRPIRKRRPTWKLLQDMPPKKVPAAIGLHPSSATATPSPPAEDDTPSLVEVAWNMFRTPWNRFGIFREYPTKPTHQPDLFIMPDDLSDIPASVPHDAQHPVADDTGSTTDESSIYAPFTNSTAFRLLQWMWSGSAQKSEGELKKLVGFLGSSDFQKDEIQDFNVTAELNTIDQYINKQGQDPSLSHTVEFETALNSLPGGLNNEWREVPIKIAVPDGKSHPSSEESPTFNVPGLHYRSLTGVIKNALGEPSSCHFHYTPFEQFFQQPTEGADLPETTRVYDEIYSSDAMLEAHKELQQSPREPGCDLERVVVAVMLYSDSTHLASFGTASAWPIYMFLGNQSKYLRCKPRAGACQHVAYLPKVRCPATHFFILLTAGVLATRFIL